MEERKRKRTADACADGIQRTIETSVVSTPIGQMVLSVCSKGLHMIYQNDEITDENFTPDPRKKVALLTKPLENEKAKCCVENCLNWLTTYFHEVGSISKLNIPTLCLLNPDGTQFRDRVLTTLAKSVKLGEVITYGELAALAGSPGAQQAVGSTMAANPFQLIVPCHRVVKAGQKVGKYSGGRRNYVKIWLLQHEGFNVDEDGRVSHGAKEKM